MSQFKNQKYRRLNQMVLGKRVTLPKTDKYFEEVNNAIAIANNL